MRKWVNIRNTGLVFSATILFGLCSVSITFKPENCGKSQEMNGPNKVNESAEMLHPRYRLRKLEYATNDESSVMAADRGTSRKIRHRKKMKKHGERFGNASVQGERETIATGHDSIVLQFRARNVAQNSVNKSVIFKNANGSASNVTDETVTRRLDLHANCYTTNEVLEIIALTCLVNFIFWFVIISCVNFYTKKQIIKNQSWDSLESSGIASEFELKSKKSIAKGKNPENMDEFVASITDDEELENNFLIPVRDDATDKRHWRMLGYCSGRECDEDCRPEWNRFGGKRPVKTPGRLNGIKQIKTNSHSMENLIF